MKEDLLEYIFRHCDAEFLSDLRVRSILKRNISIIEQIDDTLFPCKEWRYVYEYITGLSIVSDSIPYIKEQLSEWINKAS